MLSESQLRDQQEDTELARQSALRQAANATNTFAADRIRVEEQTQAELERMEEQRLDRIQSLKDDALEAERDRKQALVDLEQDTQERILDIQRKANQSREDVEREFQDAYEDIQRQRVEGTLSTDEATSQLFELGRERNRDLRNVGIREGRRVSDVERTSEDREQDIIRQAEQEALALRDILAPLLAGDSTLATQQSETAEIQSVTAAMESETAVSAAETTTAQTELVAMEAETAAIYAPAVEVFGTGAEALQTAATLLTEFDLSTLVGAVEQIPFALGSLTETLTGLPEQLGTVFTETFSQIPGLFAPMEFSALQEPPVLSGCYAKWSVSRW